MQEWGQLLLSLRVRSQWNGVRDLHGVGKVNEVGTSLLTFCALHGLCVMNTWYEKKDMYKYTWQYPGSKMWHCIDYILMHQSQRKFCRNVSVICRADCWTDHKLLRAKVALHKLRRQGSGRYRFAGYKLCDDKVRDVFNKTVVKTVAPLWDKDVCLLSVNGMFYVVDL